MTVTNTLVSRLSTLAQNLNPFATHFSTDGDVIPPTQSDRMNGSVLVRTGELADWVEKENFVNLKDMRVPAPQGLKTTYAAYLSDLESAWGMLEKIDTDLLQPLSKVLAKLANKPENLKVPTAFRPSDIRSTLLAANPEDFMALLARNFDGGKEQSRKFGKVYRGARDLDDISTKVEALNQQIDSVSRRKVSRLIETIRESSDEIAAAEVHDVVSEHLSDVLYRAAKWVELYGVFMLQAKALNECVVLTAEKIDALAKK
tara:strand:- start:387 stop:1163 length:777 start_codon:yes stop_codon:yes gene_type:complete